MTITLPPLTSQKRHADKREKRGTKTWNWTEKLHGSRRQGKAAMLFSCVFLRFKSIHKNKITFLCIVFSHPPQYGIEWYKDAIQNHIGGYVWNEYNMKLEWMWNDDMRDAMVEEVLCYCYLNVGEFEFLGMNNEQTQTYNYNGVLSTSLSHSPTKYISPVYSYTTFFV